MPEYIIFIEFMLFVGMVAARVVMLKKRGIRAFVFGATDKSDFLLLPCAALVIYATMALVFDWPVPFAGALRRFFWHNGIVRYASIVLCAAALVWLGLTLRDFGLSFRIGIDPNAPDKLVTSGMFALSRNPIYVAFFAFFFGLFLVFPNVLFLAVVVLFTAALHRQVLREEKFLRVHYGEEYAAYRKNVRRYL